METTVFLSVGFASGYVVAVYTWPLIRGWVNGIEVEAERLRAQADAMLAKVEPSAGK
jgi:hypothetical protein